jgi:hypothetical protein
VLSVRPLDGTVGNVNANAKTFALGNQNVQWDEKTAFVGTTSATMSGQAVRVDAYQSGTTLIARVIAVKNTLGELDDDHFHSDANGSDSTKAWDDYLKGRGH